MKNTSQPALTILASAVTEVLLGFMFATGAITFVHAQGQVASGTINGTGAGPYVYDLTFGDASGATSPVGSIWYAWIPGQFYLPGVPTTASAPVGWTATIAANSIQYTANSSANYLTAGQSLSGFDYQAAFSPVQLAAALNSGVSVAYSGGLFSDGGQTFTVQIASAPEPSGQMLLLSGSAILWLVSRRKFRAD
jgi:hypothetical protein